MGSNSAEKNATFKMILRLAKNDSIQVKISDGICVVYLPEPPYFLTFLTEMEMLYYARIQNIPNLFEGVNLEIEESGRIMLRILLSNRESFSHEVVEQHEEQKRFRFIERFWQRERGRGFGQV